MRSTICLPEDLIEEILSRVPTISLTRFQSISKRWNALFKDARFTKKHFTNAPSQSLVIMLINSRVCLVNIDLRNNNNNNNVVAAPVKVTSQFSLKDHLCNASKEVDICDVFHCDGLLLCTIGNNRSVVWNQCTGETRWIDNRSYKIYAIGKTSCNKYRILRMRSLFQDSRIGYEYQVYEFCSNSWRVVGVTTRDFRIPGLRRRGVFLKGNNYWVGTRHINTRENLLITFDFSTEIFRSHYLPNQFHASLSCVASLSVVREEKLCLLTSLYSDPFDVWIAETTDTEIMSWTKILTHKPSYKVYHGISFVAEDQNKVVVCTGDRDNILHIIAEDRYVEVDNHGAGNSYQFILGYVPTLVQIQQGI